MARRVCCLCRLPASAGQKLKKCTRCRLVRYCGVDCQRIDWPAHQVACSRRPPAAAAAAAAVVEAPQAATPPAPFIRLDEELLRGIREAREFVSDSIRGSRPWVADMNDGHGLGALESHAKMQLLIEVLRARHAHTFKEVALSEGGGDKSPPAYTGRFHLFETSDNKASGSSKGCRLNFLALAYGLGCSGPVVVELVPR